MFVFHNIWRLCTGTKTSRGYILNSPCILSPMYFERLFDIGIVRELCNPTQIGIEGNGWKTSGRITFFCVNGLSEFSKRSSCSYVSQLSDTR